MSKSKFNNQINQQILNVLAEKEINPSPKFSRQLLAESHLFNEMKNKGGNIFTRKPVKVGGRWYIEQLVRNTNGSFSITKVLVSKIKEGLFKEETLSLSYH
jgi:hypothetical protein